MNVLIAVDCSDHSQSVLDATVRLLQEALGEVWLLHVAEPDPDFVGYELEPTVMRDQLAEGFHREHRQLQAMAETLRGQGIAATALLIQGETVKTIVQQAEKLQVDMIVVGASGHGLWHHFLAGEVGLASLQASGRPLLVMPLAK